MSRRLVLLAIGLVLIPLLDQPAMARRQRAAASADAGLYVIPFPGTPAASPRSPVIFSSLSPAQIGSVSVVGSRSGLHQGQIEALPAGAGTALTPRRPFTPGERVRVVARLRSGAAGTASGEAGATRLSFSFAVAVAVAPGPRRAAAPARFSAIPTRSFHSAPNLHPPAVSVSSDGDTRAGDILLSPARGLMILGPHGRLLWFAPRAPLFTFDLAVQSYQGRPVLTWYQGYPGVDVIANESYQPIAEVRAADGYGLGFHDFVISPQGTAWVLATANIHADLTSVGGPKDGQILDRLIQEVDIKTGQLLWQWDCYGHIPLKASHTPVPSDGSLWDAFHLNSFQVLPDGNVLASLRNTWSVYEISRKTGRIMWTLGGRYNQFNLGPGTQFEWQHDAHLTGNTLTLLDDGADDQSQDETQSSAKVLSLNMAARTVKLIRRYTHSPPILSLSQGSVQTLANGNVFVGWGSEPYFSEYAPGGRQIFNGSFALGTTSYRAYRFPWIGHPVSPPSLAAARTSNGGTDVWTSWNGATDVVRWRVLGGAGPSSLVPLATHPDHTFETHVALNTQPAYVQVQALNAQGQVLPHGTSSVKAVG